MLSVKDLNAEIRRDAKGFAQACEAGYAARVYEAAMAIEKNSEEKPVVLLSGYSGSGKTTTAQMIEAVLDKSGHETHTLSMDNYYWRPKGMVLPVDERGDVDLESPLLLDRELLKDHLRRIGRGLPVDMPVYDFEKQQRGDEIIPLRRKKGEIIILEGIHALDPAVVGDTAEFAQTVFVCPQQVYEADGNELPPAQLRLLRRILRDVRTRGYSPENTVRKMWSVSRGERLYIDPNRFRAHYAIDSTIPYELALYTGLLGDMLRGMNSAAAVEAGIGQILPLMEASEALPDEVIGRGALVREFIGG